MELPLPPSPMPGSLRLVDHWLGRAGRGLAPISIPAALLLDQRLRLRRRALIVAAPTSVLALAASIMSSVTANVDGRGAANTGAVRYWVAFLVLVAVTALLTTGVITRGERVLAGRLPRRVGADWLESPWERLGPVRVLAVGLVVMTNVSILITLPALGAPSRLTAAFLVTLLAVCGCIAAAVRQLLLAPSVAVDADSLAVDQRIKNRDLFVSVVPLLVLATGISTMIDLLDGLSGRIGFIAVVAPGISPAFWGLELLAQSRASRSRRPPRPVPGQS